jgi:1-acyl-sn-glycerol-3-phosphate acyltransferase
MTRISTTLADPQKRSHRIAYFLVRNLVTGFCRSWCRMTVVGGHHVPAEGIFILAPTHRSIIDTPISSGVTRRRMRFMGADKWWRNKWFGRLLTQLGGFPVTRGTADREALKRCIVLLEHGEPLVLFPEGERKSGPVVQPLFEGAAYIASKTGAPIVPVGIGGSERVMPKGTRFIHPRKLYVVVGEPIPAPTGATPKDAREATRATTELLHAELQRLFDLAQLRAGVPSRSEGQDAPPR